MNQRNYYLDAVMGVVVGDALGCPVQFWTRDQIAREPVTGMRGYGTYNMPVGTWTDDGSMTLAILDSLQRCQGYDLTDIMKGFVRWNRDGEYTPFGEAFDQGLTCTEGLSNFEYGMDVYSCGRADANANGNGSLMRTAPICLYAYDGVKSGNLSEAEAIQQIHEVSGLTHNHLRAKIACGLYYFMMKAILDNRVSSGNENENSQSFLEILQKGLDEGFSFYGKDIRNLPQLAYYGRLRSLEELYRVPADEIRASGYVVDSLEAAVWSLITTGTFADSLLKAVSLGEDTDTVAAISGGLAGLWYGYDQIPQEWLDVIQRRDWIEEMCQKDMTWVYIPADLPITDMHLHVIPGVDDGSKDMEMSLKMIGMEKKQGVRTIYATSHSFAYDHDADYVRRQFEKLKQHASAKYPQINIKLGCEVNCQVPKMESVLLKLHDGTYPTMDGTKYALTEFEPDDTAEHAVHCLQLLMEKGYIPVIAHVERYAFTTLDFVKHVKEMGCLIQVNYYSLSEERKTSTRKLARAIVSNQLADVMGSDAHRMDHICPRIRSGARQLVVLTDRQYASRVLLSGTEVLQTESE